MGSIQVRGNKLYAKIKNLAGRWERVTTGRDDTPEDRRAPPRRAGSRALRSPPHPGVTAGSRCYSPTRDRL